MHRARQRTFAFMGCQPGFLCLLLSMARSSAAFRLCLVVRSRILPPKKSWASRHPLLLLLFSVAGVFFTMQPHMQGEGAASAVLTRSSFF